MEQRQSDDGRQKKMRKDVMLVTGAGQIGMAIARRAQSWIRKEDHPGR